MSIWNFLDDKEKKDVFLIGENFKEFLTCCKTERLAVEYIKQKAIEKGFNDINKYINGELKLELGSKIYAINRNKTIILFIIGSEFISSGMKIVGGHIDSPRIDLKQNPLYETDGLAYFKTHYYGGIKKYQWVTKPLALHGRVAKSNGEMIDISIGENDEEPVFYFSDILPHLSKDQDIRVANEVIKADELNLLVGSFPLEENIDEAEEFILQNALNKDNKLKVKENILKILKEKYDIDEIDFLSSELEIVPAGKARDLGFDKSMVCGYGQDDRACSYANMEAILNANVSNKTIVSIFSDKEEIGSVGNTGSFSKYFENMVCELIALQEKELLELKLRRAFYNSKVLSSDVCAAYDPNFNFAFEKQNSAKINSGVCISKYTGVRGKSGSNDANAEFIAQLIDCFNRNVVFYHTGELGKTDQGGGGTIAFILANTGAEVVDIGTPILSMHGIYEASSKLDIYMTYKAFKSFMEDSLI